MDRPTMRGRLGAASVIVTIALVLVLRSPALPVLGVGLIVIGVHLRQRRLTALRLHEVLAVPVLVGLFGVAVAMGTIGRTWAGPATVLAHAGTVGTAVVAALSSVLVNNLPAAALLASRHPPHATALLVGLNLGPNLFVTGSLAWFLWLRIARTSGASPSLRQASLLGLVIVPCSMAAALLALWLV
jgi:arsenical pump membrane protein